MKSQPFYVPDTLNSRGQLISLDTPLVMGIINVTDDSFYAGSRHATATSILKIAREMVQDGVSFIDLGAASSRPGASPVDIKTEITRLSQACEVIRRELPDALISIDTSHVEVLTALEDYHINMVNDISGGTDEIWQWTGKQNIPYVLMHMKGTPETMKSLAHYDDLVAEMLDYFIQRIPKIVAHGIHDIFIDPGIGFAKSIDHNYFLLKHLEVFQMLERPMMVGLSRKSLIWRFLQITPEESLHGSTALHMYSLQKGVKMLRVHDVKEAVQSIKIWQKLMNVSLLPKN